MTTDELVAELIAEIRRDRESRKSLEVAVASLAQDLADFRTLVFEGERSVMQQIRAVSDFVGMTDPQRPSRNGGG